MSVRLKPRGARGARGETNADRPCQISPCAPCSPWLSFPYTQLKSDLGEACFWF